jgi:hypothetical protein
MAKPMGAFLQLLVANASRRREREEIINSERDYTFVTWGDGADERIFRL